MSTLDAMESARLATKGRNEEALFDSIPDSVAEGKPITGSPYPSHATTPATALDEAPRGKFVGRGRMRLLMAFDLFTAKHSGHLTTNGNQSEIRRWCWEQVDQFFADHDRSPLPPAAPSVSTIPPFVVTYLEWLIQNGPALHTETCPLIQPDLHSEAWRTLLRFGYGSWVSDRFTPTAAGRAAIAARGAATAAA